MTDTDRAIEAWQEKKRQASVTSSTSSPKGNYMETYGELPTAANTGGVGMYGELPTAAGANADAEDECLALGNAELNSTQKSSEAARLSGYFS